MLGVTPTLYLALEAHELNDNRSAHGQEKPVLAPLGNLHEQAVRGRWTSPGELRSRGCGYAFDLDGLAGSNRAT